MNNTEIISNGEVTLCVNTDYGYLTDLHFTSDTDNTNFLISPDILRKYEYDDMKNYMLGNTLISYCGHDIDTSLRIPDGVKKLNDGIEFLYDYSRIRLTHTFTLQAGRLHWHIELKNTGSEELEIEKLLHWLPTCYIMHKDIDENLKHSCAMTPSINGSNPYLICKKRSGNGKNLIVYNETGQMRSVGSLCRFTNLFFEKSSPSLNGIISFAAVNAYKGEEKRDKAVDWQYQEMYRSIFLRPGEVFQDSYVLSACDAGREEEEILTLGGKLVEYEPVILCNKRADFLVRANSPVKSVTVYRAGEEGACRERVSYEITGNKVSMEGFSRPGERKVLFHMEDGTDYYIIFAVYSSMNNMIDAICDYIYENRFVDDPASREYCAYRSVSLQGESCTKGTLLLYKNLISPEPDIDQIRQVERNTVYFVMPNWLDDDFIPLKKYPGGFARLADLSFIALQLLLLSKFEKYLTLNDADTYLLWAYRLCIYQLEDTPDKTQRERDEMGGPFMASWEPQDMIDSLRERGHEAESEKLSRLVKENAGKYGGMNPKDSIVTEHYFDNAGLSIWTMFLMNNDQIGKGLEVAKLLLANVAFTNDYRNYAPDRWWEALAPMYHNLWAAYCAKAMLDAYETTDNNEYLFAAYRSMVPMFYNYDWEAVSALRKLQKGEGVSAYCITAPNLNLDYTSHNRFGQSVFHSPFFDRLQLAGDDWDMGMDVVLYLSTFGQNTYVTVHNDRLTAVNGRITGTIDDMWVETYAPYGNYYYIEPLKLSLKALSRSFTIEKVHIQNGEFSEIVVSGQYQAGIAVRKDNKLTNISPKVVFADAKQPQEWRKG
jgi:hypothetical protein